MFYGISGLQLNNIVNLQDDVWIEFDYKINASQQSDLQKSGHRLMLGVALDWEEANRTNRAHFFEINLFKTYGYHSAHYNPNLCTKDATYDHCYYDSAGKWAEGKYVSSELGLGIPTPNPDDQWHTVRVNLFNLVRSFQWFHPPAHWSLGKTNGLYIGLESHNGTHLYVGLKNIRLAIGAPPTPIPPSEPVPPPSNPKPPVIVPPTILPPSDSEVDLKSPGDYFNSSTHPVGFFREGSSGFRSDAYSYCSFRSGEELIASGYTQMDYDNARKISRNSIYLFFTGNCKDSSYKGLVRQNSTGLIRHKNGYCLLKSGTQLKTCGYRQIDYDLAPQEYLGDVNTYPLCKC